MNRSQRRYTNLLALATLATYVLILIGATVSARDLAATCGTWPACNGAFVVLPGDEAFVAWGHRLAAVVAGVLILVSAVGAFLVDLPRRVRFAVIAALLLFPAQVGIGALMLTTEGAVVPTVHLAVAVSIFATLLSALAWTLTATTRGDVETGQRKKDIGGEGPDSKIRAYIAMTKPRLMWLLCLVAVAGMALAVAAGSSVSLITAVATLAGGCLAIGASGTFNQVIERDRDRKMARTSDRPMANDLVPVRNAVAFGFSLSLLSALVFVLFVNVVAMLLTMLAVFFYSVVYTVILKPHTDQNVVIGGVVGALPALIGWSAVTGGSAYRRSSSAA